MKLSDTQKWCLIQVLQGVPLREVFDSAWTTLRSLRRHGLIEQELDYSSALVSGRAVLTAEGRRVAEELRAQRDAERKARRAK